jgi:hypothetical protein
MYRDYSLIHWMIARQSSLLQSMHNPRDGIATFQGLGTCCVLMRNSLTRSRELHPTVGQSAHKICGIIYWRY